MSETTALTAPRVAVEQAPASPATEPATLSVIMPFFNEEATIAEVVDRVLGLDIGLEIDLIAIDDGSTDGSVAILDAITDPRLRIARHSENRGKGAAVRTGLSAAWGELVVIQDADLEYDPSEWERLVQPILDGRCEVIYGSRFTGDIRGMRWRNLAANKLLSAMTRVLYGTGLSDMETCYKVLRWDLLEEMVLEADGFDIEPEITARLLRRGVEIRELPISYDGRSRAEGKKIGWRDGLQAVRTLLKWRVRRRA